MEEKGMRPSRNRQLSGRYWVDWIDTHAPTSEEVKDLDMMFRKKAEEFIAALEDKKIKVEVTHTKRTKQAAYLWHWAWKISQRRVLPKAAPRYTDSPPVPDIEWDHGNLADSIKGAEEMVTGFGLSVPNKGDNRSSVPPSENSLHVSGEAIDMKITWTGTKKIRMKDGSEVDVTYGPVRANKALHDVGASYGVHKFVNGRDDTHWSVDGR